MKRKLIAQGGGGYTIYLPKKWVDSKGLKAGSEVDVEEKGSLLQIAVENEKKNEIRIDVDTQAMHDLKTILTHAYRKGYDSIILNGEDIDPRPHTSSLLGFEVTNLGKKGCTIQNISEPSGEKYETILRRCFLIIKETISAIVTGLNDKYSNRVEIDHLLKEHDKFILFCRRTISKDSAKIENSKVEWELLTMLMHIEHSLYYLYKYASASKLKAGKETINLVNNLSNYFELLYLAHFEKDKQKIHKINTLKSKYQFGDCYRLIEKSNGTEAVALSHIRETFRLIQLASSPVFTKILE